jgi:hypothetical protein
LTFVAYEDRSSDEIGLMLLAVSFERAIPGDRLICYCPSSFTKIRKLAAGNKRLEIRDSDALDVRGWETKPSLLLRLLDEGHDDVVWLDSDLILLEGAADLVKRSDPRTLLITEEHLAVEGTNIPDMAALAGMKSVRTFQRGINSCVIGVTPVHREILTAWSEAMRGPAFQAVQQLSYFDRPRHLQSDQDVLAALLGSERFADIPVRQLRSGTDVAHCWFYAGFSAKDRLRALWRGLPPVIHSPGNKPWRRRMEPNRLPRIALDISTYNSVARRFGNATGEDMGWTKPEMPLGKLLYAAGLGHPVIPGLLLQMLVAVYRSVGWIRRSVAPL